MARKTGILNVATIGLGMGRHHLSTYHEYGRSRAAAICDADPKRLAEFQRQVGLPDECCFTDYRKLLRAAKGLDLHAASVALPNALHAPVSWHRNPPGSSPARCSGLRRIHLWPVEP